MSITRYSVLIGRPIGHRFGAGANSHYQVHVVDDTTDYRIAVNVKSSDSPSELEYLTETDFNHPLLEELASLPVGIHPLESKPNSPALDFIRGNLFDRRKMRLLPDDIPGPDNDLNEEINRYIQKAMADEDALVYAFGERWGPEPNKKDKYFGFKPGNGIHDIHMNQGNPANGKFKDDNGVYHDGALLIHLPSERRWVAIFLKFQSQSWHTDDTTGYPSELNDDNTQPPIVEPQPQPLPLPLPGEPDFVVRIVAALVNPSANDQGAETVTLLNTSSAEISLDNWAIANKAKTKFTLHGKIAPGATLTFTLPVDVPLSNQGGIITLLNQSGLKVHGVKYTKQQASREGWSIVFS